MIQKRPWNDIMVICALFFLNSGKYGLFGVFPFSEGCNCSFICVYEGHVNLWMRFHIASQPFGQDEVDEVLQNESSFLLLELEMTDSMCYFLLNPLLSSYSFLGFINTCIHFSQEYTLFIISRPILCVCVCTHVTSMEKWPRMSYFHYYWYYYFY